ncbi:MAG: hypothetical protein V4671_01735 [Armatimonadota bacterium]
MPTSLFEKGIVTCTFLVTLADIPQEDLQRLPDGQNIDELRRMQNSDSKQPDVPELPDIKDDPQFWAGFVVDKLFSNIIR